MKNIVSYDLSEKFSIANKTIEAINNTLTVLEKENKNLKDIFNSLISINSQDYNLGTGELGDTKYAHSA
jgi:hypothetical protein